MMVTHRYRLMLALAALPLAACGLRVEEPDAAGSDVVVGIMEEHIDTTTGKPSAFVRAAFYKVGGAWKAYDPACDQGACFPRQTTWTVSRSGKAIGTVEGVTPSGWSTMGDVGRQSLAEGAKAPFVGEPSETFSGWSGGSVRRPLVSVSSPNVSDPGEWKPMAVSANMAKALHQRIRAKFPTAQRCASAEQTEPAEWKYADSDLVVDEAYSSGIGWKIARVGLNPDAYRCDGMLPDTGESAFSALTVAFAPDGELIDLGHDMRLLDTGDYDADGRSELVFIFSHYNSDGYRLFSDDFNKSITFGYSFH
ncbi:hypothetical protein [Blastomonas sp.]|uniref:hypothetical protein n=1 Tax=Blastomonas sp. TaxID=1909299 RepID=UPI00391A735B